MAEVTITISGRHYDISCDSGQEGRIIDLAGYIDGQISRVSQTGAAYNDSHLQILTLLVLADELFEEREQASGKMSAGSKAEHVISDTQIKDIEKTVRDEVQAEYAERLSLLQTQLANSDRKAKENKDFEVTSEGKAMLKVLQHLTDRVNGLSAQVESL